MDGKIRPSSWAVAGKFKDQDYDGINVMPLLDQEKILITVTAVNNELKKVAEVPFPAVKQTPEQFLQLIKTEIARKLMVLI